MTVQQKASRKDIFALFTQKQNISKLLMLEGGVMLKWINVPFRGENVYRIPIVTTHVEGGGGGGGWAV